jgi:hypothetical protein
MTNNIPPRPKSRIEDFTSESRGIEKILELISDELHSIIEELDNAPEYDTPEWDAAETHLYECLREALAPITID